MASILISMNSENTGKYHFFHFHSIIISKSDMFLYFLTHISDLKIALSSIITSNRQNIKSIKMGHDFWCSDFILRPFIDLRWSWRSKYEINGEISNHRFFGVQLLFWTPLLAIEGIWPPDSNIIFIDYLAEL